MKTLLPVLAILGAIGFAAMAHADDKKVEKADNAKLIVGKWEATKADPGTLPAGSTAEFTADGKVKVVAKDGGKEETVEGTYTVTGDTLDFTAKFGGEEKKEKLTIKKLSDTEMELADKEGKGVTFKRKK
jgi:uncharacterized protein (TIGR03066 family)